MKSYRMLILTNHKTHNDTNSLYGLARHIATHPRCAGVDVASVVADANTKFLATTSDSVSVVSVDLNFTYDLARDRLAQSKQMKNVKNYDVIFLRLPHPISDKFLLWLEQSVGPKKIFNRPSGVIEVGSKAFLLQLAKYCPPMQLCKTPEEVKAYAAQFPIVLKPLRSHGGKGIVRIQDETVSLGTTEISLDVFFAKHFAGPYLAVRFLKQVGRGDKRIVVINGHIVCAMLRVPAPGHWLCNVAQGGSARPISVTDTEREIVAAINPILLEKGVVMYGLDTLIGHENKRIISEINTMSVGGLVPAQELSGKPVLKSAARYIWQYIITYIS